MTLPQEYKEVVLELAEYFNGPKLICKSLYGTDVAAEVWNQDLTDWLTTNEIVQFKQSEVNPSLFIHRKGEEYIFLIVYIDDSLYFGLSNKLEEKFVSTLSKRFKMEAQGRSHWFYRSDKGVLSNIMRSRKERCR